MRASWCLLKSARLGLPLALALAGAGAGAEARAAVVLTCCACAFAPADPNPLELLSDDDDDDDDDADALDNDALDLGLCDVGCSRAHIDERVALRSAVARFLGSSFMYSRPRERTGDLARPKEARHCQILLIPFESGEANSVSLSM